MSTLLTFFPTFIFCQNNSVVICDPSVVLICVFKMSGDIVHLYVHLLITVYLVKTMALVSSRAWSMFLSFL